VARPKKRPDPELIAEAAAELEAARRPELAAAVRALLPELTRPRTRAGYPTITLYVWGSTWQAALAEAERRGVAVGDLVDEGYAALMAGRWKPRRPKRGEPGASPDDRRQNQSTGLDAGRRAQVTAWVAEHADELGWKPSDRQVGAAWLEHKYGPKRRRT
jgi:hypothetical protein